MNLFFSPWKYLINLAGSELPVYSVDELSQRLSETSEDFKIATDSYFDKRFKRRFQFIRGKPYEYVLIF